MNEIWKDVIGYEGLYVVSNFGNVKNSKSNRMLKQENAKGYKRVTLRKNNTARHFTVHRLVATAFLENPYDYPCINHIDENTSNNRLDNLEWCTYSYNINFGSRNFKVMRDSKPVAQMDFAGNVLAKYISIGFASKILNVDPSNIYKCCNGKTQYAYEYKWKFISDFF